MLRIAICDDIPCFADMLKKIVEKWMLKNGVNVQLGIFFCGEELLADVEESGAYNIIFMDIEMKGGISGITTAKILKEKNESVCLIYVSQLDNCYKEAFETYPFQYMEKPVSEHKVTEVLERAVKRHYLLNEVFVFKFRNTTCSIELRNVLYFVSDKRIIRIFMKNGDEYAFYEKLDELENRLKDRSDVFLRIHKSYLINGRQVEQFHARYVVMRNKEKLPVSQEKRSRVLQYHVKMLESD